jgi:hypothetical protein
MIAVWRWSKIVRLTLAAGLSIAVTPTFAATDASSEWSLASNSYIADGGDMDISYVSHEDGSDCDSCNCNPCCCEPCWTCMSGAEATFLVPEIDDGFAGAAFANGLGGGAAADASDLDLHDFTYSPRVWLGAHKGDVGIVGRFWHLDTCDDNFDPFEANGFGFDSDSALTMQTIDLELTKQICRNCKEYVVTFGVRYAEFDHSTDIQTISQAGVATFVTDSFFQQYARGTGLTSSLSGASPICGTCVSWFYSARGSYLFGHTDTTAATSAAGGIGGAQVFAANGATAEIDDPFLIAELQLGVIAEYSLKCYPANAFVRVAGEMQHWSGDESEAFATSFVGVAPGAVAVANAATAGLDTNLFGVSIATGLTY